jgi:hypothetical protein
MKKEIENINNEKVLLEYLYARLENGITDGISEKEYYKLLNKLIENINNDKSEFAIKVNIIDESFEATAKKAINKTLKCHSNGLYFDNQIMYPNYKLTKLDWNDYKVFPYGRGETIMKKTLTDFINPQGLSQYSFLNVDDYTFDLAKRIGAYFVNDLIERYMSSSIENGHWPKQCKNVDEFIFKRDIGFQIDELGTKSNFTLAYYQAIRIILELLENEKSIKRELIFSNNENICLSYANYLKMILPFPLSFLLPYKYNQYELMNASIEVSVIDNQAYFKTSECIYSDPYGDFSNDFKSNKGVITDAPVLVMEKRIGKIHKQ